MVSVLDIVIVALVAGVGGTGFGGVVGALFRKSGNHVISLLLSATGGVMIAIVCFELLPESVAAARGLSSGGLQEFEAVMVATAAVAAGVAVVLVLNAVIDRVTSRQVEHTSEKDHPQTHDSIDELMHADHYNEHVRAGDDRRHLWTAGVVIACVIALHNVPEGMSIGASFAIQAEGVGTALMLAFLIGVHNVPEGMAVSVPLIAGGMGRAKAIVLTALSGLPLVLGALLGLWLGDIGPLGLSCSLGFASGAMLYVVFGEIIPQAILMYRSKVPAISAIAGILVGVCMIYL